MMNSSIFSFVFLWLSLLPTQGVQATCADPLASVKATMDCGLVTKDAECAAAGYAPEGFLRVENGGPVSNLTDRSVTTWMAIHLVSNLSLVYIDSSNYAPNIAYLHYNESLELTDGSHLGLPPSNEYPFGFTNLQTEEAWVEVNDDCQIILWNQTSRDGQHALAEQAWADLFSLPQVFCVFDPSPAVCNASNAGVTADNGGGVEETESNDGSVDASSGFPALGFGVEFWFFGLQLLTLF